MHTRLPQRDARRASQLGWTPAWAALLAVLLLLGRASQAQAATGHARLIRVNAEVARAPGRTSVYLNRCAQGCTVLPGNSDARAHTSPLVAQPVQLPPFAYDDATWNAVVACVADVYAPFQIDVVTTPPLVGDYTEHMVAGSAQTLGQPAGTLGVAPFACGYLPNATSFTFADTVGANVEALCWTAAQEIAHSFGLDHKFDARDAMTYLEGDGTRKRFVNAAGPCGEQRERACLCGDAQQNSFTTLAGLFGTQATLQPEVSMMTPRAEATIAPGFALEAVAVSAVGVASVAFFINDRPLVTLYAPPFRFVAPKQLYKGKHRVAAVVTDIYGVTTRTNVTVYHGTACQADADCEQAGLACASGVCIVGPNAESGLGDTCTSNRDCASGQCAMAYAAGQPQGVCVAACQAEAPTACPTDFACVKTTYATPTAGVASTSAPATEVCVPQHMFAPTNQGCSAASSHGGGSLALLCAIVALLTRRRRHRGANN